MNAHAFLWPVKEPAHRTRRVLVAMSLSGLTAADRMGFWSAVGIVAVCLAYAVALAAGFARHGFDEPIADPVLAVMEVLTLLSAPLIVLLWSAMVDRAEPEQRAWAVSALVFAALCAGTTMAVHFTELTAVRQLGGGGIVWPSRLYAAELLAWDVFLGLALVCAAPVFRGGGLKRAVRRGLMLCGILCLMGTVGPVVGNMRLQLVGVFGYAVVLPIVCVPLARLFRRSERA